MFRTNKIVEMLENLKRVEAELSGPANRNPRSGFKSTISFLEKNQNCSLDELVSLLASKKKKKPVTRSKAPLRQKKVELHVTALKEAGTQLSRFEQAIAELKGDKQVRLQELKVIVREYAQDISSFTKKDVGFGIIAQAFDQRWKLFSRRL